MDKQHSPARISRMFVIGGACIALLIGSGFATGQEIMQYFVAYEYAGLASIALMFLLFTYVALSFVMAGYEQQFSAPKDIFRYYCGKPIGTFFDYFSVLFLYMSFWVMIAGAGAALNQQFGWPNWYGGVLMGGLTLVTLFFGFNRLISVVGSIGPLLSVLAIVIGVAGVLMAPEGLEQYPATLKPLVEDKTVLQAGSSWFTACLSYVGFCMMWLAAFMTNLGSTSNNRAEAGGGAVLGMVLFSLAVLAMMLGLAAHLEDVASAQIPSLILVEKLSPSLSGLVTLVIFAAIYTTAASLLWAPVKRFAPDEFSARHRGLLCVLCVVGTAVGLNVPFDALINVVYVLNGYIGFCLLFLMLVTDFKRRVLKRSPQVIGQN
ncbi:hypothetical protein NJF44_14520 [Pseudomonas guariconensis]|uniref:YkvI family membrane protein n=1 Tax=Pseudomonas TaxID=286 RepID=UPI001CE3B821|nr:MULTISPECIES: hypothetical protein [Pseudomonas]MCO7640218.1 hypothetical protein [Pseudomonas sp. S 311-6]MCO7515949.1 hypothetical protein [Pseudomonas putida]MCO7565590.1 hypothetical protein [Pseudomonas mosselii]MCO7593249.1 hypothetical protein [Pseudomonas guariconensis]MCO7606452.1 hypothetical protein [Pseudomonas guariconensis]